MDVDCATWLEAFVYRTEISVRQSEVVCFGRDLHMRVISAFVS